MGQKVPKFDYYEKVVVRPPDGKKVTANGQVGAVRGRVEAGEGGWYYTVHLDATNTSWRFWESELLPTGERARREDFLDGAPIRVAVDDTGKGSVVGERENGTGRVRRRSYRRRNPSSCGILGVFGKGAGA